MGGHCQFGEYKTLDDAIEAWANYKCLYEDKYHLWLKYAQITWDDTSRLYKLAMRFTK